MNVIIGYLLARLYILLGHNKPEVFEPIIKLEDIDQYCLSPLSGKPLPRTWYEPTEIAYYDSLGIPKDKNGFDVTRSHKIHFINEDNELEFKDREWYDTTEKKG